MGATEFLAKLKGGAMLIPNKSSSSVQPATLDPLPENSTGRQITLSAFLAAFFPDENEPVHLRAFKAKGAPDTADNRPLTWRVTRQQLASDKGLQHDLCDANKTRGLYFVVNAGGNTDKAIMRYNAFFAESDTATIAEQHAALDTAPLHPSIRVETRKSVHGYWLLDGDCTEGDWRDVQARLIAFFGGDDSIKNPSRVMRLPFFNHVHYDGEGYEYKRVNVAHYDPATRYTVAQMLTAFPPVEPDQHRPRQTPPNAPTSRATAHNGAFSTHDERHEELARRIMARATQNAQGNYDAVCVAHNGTSKTGLVYFPDTGAVKCLKGSCDYAALLRAEGLSDKPLPKAANGTGPARATAETVAGVPRLGFTFGELLTLDLPAREEIIFGLGRGEMGLVNAVNNAGKTTLLRNLMVSLCTGRPFAPMGNFSLPKRVAFLDLEDTLTFLRHDLRVMLAGFSGAEQARFNDNALLVCEARLHDEDLNLSNSLHLSTVTKQLASFAPDLIIVDTIASAFQIRNENDNAEVRRFITRPLRQLAKDCNAAVLAAHHIGKAKTEEGQTREASHKGRGASSFADMARLVLNLEKDNINDTVILSCAKVKGPKFADTILRLDLQSRWFASQGEKREPTNYELFLEVFSDGQAHARAEVDAELDGVLSKQSVTRFLSEAVKSGKLKKLGHGKYQNAQMLTPIRDEHLSISTSTNVSNDLPFHEKDAEKGREHLSNADDYEEF